MYFMPVRILSLILTSFRPHYDPTLVSFHPTLVWHLQPNSDHLQHLPLPTLQDKLRTQTFRKGATHKLKPSPSCCKFDKQTPNLCLNQSYLHNTQASHTYRKIFINPPKLIAQPRSIALIDHNRRGYQRGTRPDQHASKYAPEQTAGGTYMPHGHFFIFILSSFFYLSSETSYDFLVKPVSFLTSPQRIS